MKDFTLGAGGPGLPLVLIPGVEGDPRVWSNQVALGSRRPARALGLPRGQSSLAGMADAVLRAVDAPRFRVLGLSLGGLVGWAMAARSDRVVGLVAVNALPGRALLPVSIGAAHRVLDLVPDRVFDWLYARRIHARLIAEGVDADLAVALTADLPGRTELRRRLAAVLAWGLPATTGVPTLWLRGRGSRETPWNAADVARLLPDARSEEVAGGHRAPLTHSGPFNAVVEEWLDGQG